MKKQVLALAVFALAGSSLAEEKTFTLKISQPLELYGGVTGAYLYTTNDNSGDAVDGFRLTNAVIGLTGSSEMMSFDLAIGTFLAPSVWDGGIPNTPISYTTGDSSTSDSMGLLWGYVTLSPFENVSVDAGLLTTNVGYEVINTYSNPNVTLGAVWYAQPVIYPGVRVTFEATEDISFYAEYNNDSINPRSEAFAVGSLGSFGDLSYALTYYDYTGFKNFVDVVLSYSIGSIDLGLNFDYQWLDDSAKQPGQDDSAYGIALYFIPNFGNISVPVRVEYFDEGTSGIYWGGADTGYTATITPTFKPSENTFVRAEVSYISTDNKVFKNGTEDTKTTFAVELGFTF